MGDSQHKSGFSLKRTILGQAVELDPHNQDLYFQLDVRQMSIVPEQARGERLAHINASFKTNEAQRVAMKQSTTRITAGISLIQGPPGTGKTRTAMIITLTLASLNFKVLLCAGSNNNLTHTVARALKQDERLRSWCGQLTRLRTQPYQLGVLRQRSATDQPIRHQRSLLSGLESSLLPFQAHSKVVAYAEMHRGQDACRDLLSLLDRDQAGGLSRAEPEKLENAFSDT
jgi:ATP-dependent RNA/DNA helicase IGHMBP2